MCVILVKKPTAQMPSETILYNCFYNNPDGSGIMWNGKDGKVHISKGYMDYEEFVKKFHQVAENNPTATIVAHCRITTQGGVQKELCHPYPITYQLDKLRLLKCKCSLGVAHNGIISLTSDSSKTDRNDTMQFIKKYLVNIIDFDKGFYKNKAKMNLIKNLIGTSNKLAILDGDGHVELINQFYLDKKTGLLFSNGSYDRTPITKKFALSEYREDDYSTYDLDTLNQLYNEGLLAESDGYMFDECNCPASTEHDYSFCDCCLNKNCICSLEHYRK